MRSKLLFFTTFLWILSLAILMTIYLAWLIYPLEISWLKLENTVYLSSKTIQYNFTILMNYLTNPFQWTLHMPDFRSSADGLHHFQAVKYLFHLVQAIFLVTLPGLYLFVKEIVLKGYLILYRRAFQWMIFLSILIAVLGVLVGFDTFFTLFHQVLFVGDSTWLFDPNLDPVIWILPEEFFLHAFLTFFVLYEGFACLGLFLSTRKGEKDAVG